MKTCERQRPQKRSDHHPVPAPIPVGRTCSNLLPTNYFRGEGGWDHSPFLPDVMHSTFGSRMTPFVDFSFCRNHSDYQRRIRLAGWRLATAGPFLGQKHLSGVCPCLRGTQSHGHTKGPETPTRNHCVFLTPQTRAALAPQGKNAVLAG